LIISSHLGLKTPFSAVNNPELVSLPLNQPN
jgi:hypothetical protein